MTYSQELQNKILSYYRKYYQSCGLKDAEQRAHRRLKEEETEVRRMKRLQSILNIKFVAGQKHFIFGAGTGGLAVVLAKDFACDVFGIEPCQEEFWIIQAKCREAGINPENFKQEFGENLSFQDQHFDFVHCFTVLEHVQDVEECLKEMIRITKPGGIIYINTPNYTYPEERHYKIVLPTFLGKTLACACLFLRRKPLKFLKTINFITEKGLNKTLSRQEGIYWLRIYQSSVKKKGLKGWFLNFFRFTLGVYPKQEVVILKRK